MTGWPLERLRLRHRDLLLRPVTEVDLPGLVELFPADVELDPSYQRFGFHDEAEHRARVLVQTHWRARGTWTPQSWALDLLVERGGRPIGVQWIEADQFATLGTVDSASWLVPSVRGAGYGVAMRQTVLALAFEQLGAVAAISSARSDNAASLAVSRRCGYLPDGVSTTMTPTGPATLQQFRLTAAQWRAGAAVTVAVEGLEGCRDWFGAPT